ncbi:unnamed protein product [Somion occarium]|uniref:SAP domain-containing protein n=1 Tax=Somion occarium TaxID=3059160 RepID=A0ABP1DQH4_9APHY
MATTTQILFNSPALHSLKRDQLVKLCKIHGIKANGKNVELIERLKVRATELPPEAATIQPEEDNEQDDNNHDNHVDATNDSDVDMSDSMQFNGMPRLSERWEMVMEDIEEVDETTLGTMSSMNTLRSTRTAGEFGSKNSKSTMTSSIKALANSLGIKRSYSGKSIASHKEPSRSSVAQDELDQHAVPYSSLPPPDFLPATDHFKLSTPDVTMSGPDDSLNEPIPGSPSRPGAPAPSNARLSTGEGLTTTIRLITSPFDPSNVASPPRLQPLQPSFDLIMSPGSDQQQRVNVWPASPNNGQRLYPAVPFEDLPSLNAIVASSSNYASPAKPMPSNDTQDIFSPQKVPAPPVQHTGRLSLPQNQPFLFGSPLPQPRLSNKDFGKAAASVLDEMNKRLAEAGVQKVDAGVLKRDTTDDIFGSTVNQIHQRTNNTDRFAKTHEAAFNQMDSIVNHYAARRGQQPSQPASKKRESDTLGLGTGPGAKRKSTVAGHTGHRVISNGVRKNMSIPGGFGDDEEEDEPEHEEVEAAGDRRSSKRIRITESDVTKGRRISLVPPAPGQTAEERQRQERRKSRDHEAMKKRLDGIKARRRSSRGRPSLGKASAPKPSRFGFLSSAKTLVRNVWNMGAGSSKPVAPPSNIPVPKPSAPVKAAPSTAPVAKAPSVGLGHPSMRSTTATSGIRSSSGASNNSHLAPKTARSTSTLTASRSRSPIPSFNVPPKTGGTAPSRTSGIAQPSVASKRTSVMGSSMGTRTSLASTANGGASSMGAKRSLATGASSSSVTHARKDSNTSVGSKIISPGGIPRRPSSSLMAPTASSLAKMRGSNAATSINAASSPRTLQSILNTPQKSPKPTKIFSKPLPADFGSPTSPPTPAHNTSLAAAATTIMNNATAGSNRPGVPPKPPSLAGRRPRISRSRVIAKLGAQRAATSGSSGSTAEIGGPRNRSSMGAARRSLGVVKNNRTASGGDVVMSAKKKARQSEYARRRSHVKAARASSGRPSLGGPSLSKSPLKTAGRLSGAMDLDDD